MQENIKRDVIVTITGVQKIDGDEDKTEIITEGRYYRKNGVYFIYYDESEATGFANCKTTIKVEGEQKVTLMRDGALQTNLIVDVGTTNIGLYGTAEGELQIGVNAKEIKSTLSDNGGEVSFKYGLTINSEYVSDNEVYVKIEERKK